MVEIQDVTTQDLVARTRMVAMQHDALPSVQAVLPVIDWGSVEKYKPLPVAIPLPPANAPLPNVDIVIMTWTIAEWAALHHVFCGYDQVMHMSDVSSRAWQKDWIVYGRDYHLIHQYMVDVDKTYQGGAPSLGSMSWGSYRLVSVNGLRILLVKSGMHLAQDGTGLPLQQFVRSICKETSPQLLLSIGTAGGVREEDALGCALITNQAYFHLLKEFRGAYFNQTTVRSDWQPVATHVSEAQSRVIQVAGFPIRAISPQYPIDQVIEPDVADSKIKIVTDLPIITTDTFLFGTTENGLDKLGCIVEMDDAVVGAVCQEMEVPFGFVRNVSDPVIDARLPASVQEAWAAYIYRERGLFTSYNGALAAWALVAAESDK